MFSVFGTKPTYICLYCNFIEEYSIYFAVWFIDVKKLETSFSIVTGSKDAVIVILLLYCFLPQRVDICSAADISYRSLSQVVSDD